MTQSIKTLDRGINNKAEAKQKGSQVGLAQGLHQLGVFEARTAHVSASSQGFRHSDQSQPQAQQLKSIFSVIFVLSTFGSMKKKPGFHQSPIHRDGCELGLLIMD